MKKRIESYGAKVWVRQNGSLDDERYLTAYCNQGQKKGAVDYKKYQERLKEEDYDHRLDTLIEAGLFDEAPVEDDLYEARVKQFGLYEDRYWRLSPGRCLTCNSREELTLHHIIPLEFRGHNHIWNLVTLCSGCDSFIRGRQGFDGPFDGEKKTRTVEVDESEWRILVAHREGRLAETS